MAMSEGGFVWYELMTSDVEAAAAFYAKVVGWSMAGSGMPGMDYTLAKVGERQVAGLTSFPPDVGHRKPTDVVRLRPRRRHRRHGGAGEPGGRRRASPAERHPGRRPLRSRRRSAGRDVHAVPRKRRSCSGACPEHARHDRLARTAHDGLGSCARLLPEPVRLGEIVRARHGADGRSTRPSRSPARGPAGS